MAMKSLEHDDARIMRCLTPKIALLSIHHWNGDCNFEHLPIPVGVRREQSDGFRNDNELQLSKAALDKFQY